jgi:N-acetylneuraminic acid mutarotase
MTFFLFEYKDFTMLRILFLCFTCAALSAYGQTENDWEKRASFGGLDRERAVAFSVGDFGYVGTGVDTAENTHNDLWQYDSGLDTWTQVASMPASERRNAVAFSIDDKGYVGTGFSHDDGDLGVKLKDFWSYDPVANSWTAIADYPGGGDTGMYSGTAFSVLGKGYVACGKIGSNAYLNELWEYDPEMDTWTARTPFPGGVRYQLVSFAVENKAYVGLGTDNDVFRKDFYEYDPITNTWEDAPEFPGSERAQASTFSIGSKGFVVFGLDGGYKEELWEFDFYTQNWTLRAPFPGGGRKYAIAFAIADTGYAGIGKEPDGKKKSFYAYTPLGPLSAEESNQAEIKIYPNPASDFLMINPGSIQADYTIQLCNLKGEMLIHAITAMNQHKLNIAHLESGLYLIILRDSHGKIISSKKINIL